ncbi:pseudaminic acid cytidylyltransferase [Chitinibacter sp. S2-10]|uniref:pseudaminic acid cytidylyltransferase n=1 Tax=Chitinibacter sp. S2-10 TaxID=3373597 RepID=UPI00397751B9
MPDNHKPKPDAIAVIPARGGSKRIPRKNIKLFHGKPMLAYSIEAARACGEFKRIVVSTDDEEIAQTARALGAEVPFMRPAVLSDDYATTMDVMQHAIRALQQAGESADLTCCIYATAPLLRPQFLNAAAQILRNDPAADYVFSVTHFDFPVQRALVCNAQGQIDALYPQYRDTRSQDLPEAFHDAGQFYWGRSAAWLSGEVLYSPRARPVILPRYLVQDIDTPDDWRRAEYMYAAMLADGTALS